MQSTLKLEYSNRNILGKRNSKWRKFNIPEWIILYRVSSWPFLIWAIVSGERNIFAWLLLVSFISDFCDGMLSRRLRAVNDRGIGLEVLGEKLTLITAVAGFIYYDYSFLTRHTFLISILMGLIIIQAALSLFRYRKMRSFRTIASKISFTVSATFLVTTFFAGPIEWLFYLTVLLAILKTVEDIAIMFLLPVWRTNVKGLYWLINEN